MKPTSTSHSDIQAGGKGSRLLQMQMAGFRVPPLRIVPPSFQLNWLHRLDLVTDYIRYFKSEEPAGNLIGKLKKSRWTDQETEQILALYREVSDDGKYPVSVRSSGLMEDLPGYSFAGQYETVLNITSGDDVSEAVRTCLISPLNERIREYIRYHHLQDVFRPWMALVIQRMVSGETSGVLFSWNVTAQKPGFVVSAGYGLGEGVVSGKVETDEWVFDENRNLINRTIASKTNRMISRSDGSVMLENVPGKEQDEPCISEIRMRTLLDEGQKLTDHFGKPQDVEFTIAGGELYLLQSRDVTRIDQNGQKVIFDNSNIVESYSGVTTPLTYTFIRPAYEQVYRQFFDLMGVRPKQIDNRRRDFATMVTWIDGRVFYNMNSWFRVLSLLPGYQFNRSAMEDMMGVRDKGNFEHIETPPSYTGLKKLTHGLPQILYLIYRLIRNIVLSQRITDRFNHLFHTIFDDLEQQSLDAYNSVDLANLYWKLEEELLKNWKAPIVTDFNAMIFHGMLKKLSEKWLPDEKKGLTNDLLVGLGNVESAEPTRLLVKMAETCREHPEIVEKLNLLDHEEVAVRYLVDPDFDPIRGMIEDYLSRFGYRCIGELKLEESTVRDNPAFLFRMIWHFLQSGTTNSGMEEQEMKKRAQAEADLKNHLGGFRRLFYRQVLNQARKHIRNREDLRFNRTRIFGKIREIFRGIGREMAANKLIDDPKDVFYLTRDELLGYTDGTSLVRDHKKLIALRKEERKLNQTQQVEDHFETRGAVMVARDQWLRREPQNTDGLRSLKGTACSPGRVKGEVIVVRSPADQIDVRGKIMVAEQTDPGWVPLFPLVSGLLVERGGLLSHSAVVGREMGIPTVVGLRYLTQILNSGDLVEMDGSTGEVTILNRKDADENKS
ncbi:MAG: hypothetical protein EA364_08375 [Balneolaceae bacterium]|nr:MAG: hypothetical protein EA364_08375 [Balneolaceae bacterium]